MIEDEEKKEQEKEAWGPPKYDSISQTKNTLVFYGTCYYGESYDDMPIIDFMVPNNDFGNEYFLDMEYARDLDDGPMVVDIPPCLTIITNSCEDKNYKIDVFDDTLIYESPISFLSFPIYITEEKYALSLPEKRLSSDGRVFRLADGRGRCHQYTATGNVHH